MSQFILKQGCRWRIEDGSSINIWHDPWLKNNDNLKLLTPIIEGLEVLQVQDLFIPGSRDWDIELREEPFCLGVAIRVNGSCSCRVNV